MLKGKTKTDSHLSTWMEFEDGFEVHIMHVPLAKLEKLKKQCRKWGFDPKTHQRREELDEDKFNCIFFEAVCDDWRGLTPEFLRKHLDMTEYPETEVPWSVEDGAELSASLYGFQNFLWFNAQEMALFRAAEQAQEKKDSSTSHAGNSKWQEHADGVSTAENA